MASLTSTADRHRRLRSGQASGVEAISKLPPRDSGGLIATAILFGAATVHKQETRITHCTETDLSLTTRLGERIQLVGDDIFVTNPKIIADAIRRGIGNAALIKVNQIGTVTETLEAIATCRRGGYSQLVSHRSGETTDTFIADLAVSCGSGELKTGAPARGERVAKYNRLIEIAAAHPSLPYGIPAP